MGNPIETQFLLLLSPAQNPSVATNALKKKLNSSTWPPWLPGPGQPISLSILWALTSSTFLEPLFHLEPFYVLLLYPQPQNPWPIQYYCSFTSYLKPHPREVFPDPNPGQIPQNSGLDHLQTQLRFIFTVLSPPPHYEPVKTRPMSVLFTRT